MHLREQPVTFRSGGEQIVGMLHLPRTKKRCPAVVMLHGFTGGKTEMHRLFVRMARRLAGLGIASLRFDFRGSGDSAGEFSEMTPSREKADAKAALAWLRRRREIDTERIGILGMSLGGMITALMLGEDRRIFTAVLWNPVGNPRRLADIRMTPEARAQLRKLGVIDMGGWPVGRGFVNEMRKLKPLKSIVKSKAPLLFIHAENDGAVPLSETQDYRRALERKGRSVQFKLIAGADHTFNSLAWEREVFDHTAAWFQRLLAANV